MGDVGIEFHVSGTQHEAATLEVKASLETHTYHTATVWVHAQNFPKAQH
jgi:hypothetical protein